MSTWDNDADIPRSTAATPRAWSSILDKRSGLSPSSSTSANNSSAAGSKKNASGAPPPTTANRHRRRQQLKSLGCVGKSRTGRQKTSFWEKPAPSSPPSNSAGTVRADGGREGERARPPESRH